MTDEGWESQKKILASKLFLPGRVTATTTTMNELFDANATILHLVPNTLPGLIESKPIYEILLESIDDDSMRKQLLDIDRSLTELTFDKDKAVVLTMLLGPKFTNALDIVMNLEITGDLSNLIITPVAKRDVPHLLSKVGLSKESFQLLNRERGLATHTDMTNWYCDCAEYQECYSNDMDITTIAGDSLVHQLLSELKSRVLSPVPVCSHILAVLIIKYNSHMFEIDLCRV